MLPYKKNSPNSDYIFMTELKTPTIDFTFRKIISSAGIDANLDMPIHPHMLRHSTGFKLANDDQYIRSIQFCLGHKNIQHTLRYTEISSVRFKKFCLIYFVHFFYKQVQLQFYP
jgi:site-specific recombinase XerD